MPPNRQKLEPKKYNPRDVVEGAKQAIHGPDPDPKFTEFAERFRQYLLAVPQDRFDEGVRAEKSFKEDICSSDGRNPLGPYIEPPPKSHTREIGGEGHYLLFPDFIAEFFDNLTPEICDAILVVGRKQVRKMILAKIVKENWIKASAFGSFAFMSVQYGAQAFVWVNTNLPAIRTLWQFLKSGISQ